MPEEKKLYEVQELLNKVHPPEFREVIKKSYEAVEPKVLEVEEAIFKAMPQKMSRQDKIVIQNAIRVEAFQNVLKKVSEMINEELKRRIAEKKKREGGEDGKTT